MALSRRRKGNTAPAIVIIGAAIQLVVVRMVVMAMAVLVMVSVVAMAMGMPPARSVDARHRRGQSNHARTCDT